MSYQVEVTITFKANWQFPHNDKNKIQDAITQQYHDRIRTIKRIMPMFLFDGYKYHITRIK